jgi:hypothetical protein
MPEIIRANVPTIRINGKVFTKIPHCCDAVRVTFYRHDATQQEVRVSWIPLFSWWEVRGVSTYYVATGDLSRNLLMDDDKIPNYFTSEQEKALDRILTEVLLKTEKR